MSTTGEVLKPCDFYINGPEFSMRLIHFKNGSVRPASEAECRLWDALLSAPQGNAAQEGYVLVPVEPTDEMITGMCIAHEFSQFHDLVGPMKDAYADMIKSRPIK